MIPEPCSIHTNTYLYMLDDQPFLIDSIMFLSQWPEMVFIFKLDINLHLPHLKQVMKVGTCQEIIFDRVL